MRVAEAPSASHRGPAAKRAARSASPAAPTPVRDDRPRRIVPGGAGHPSPWMRARSAMIEPFQRAAIIGVAERRAGPEQLIERERAMEDVAAGQAEHLLEVERAARL